MLRSAPLNIDQTDTLLTRIAEMDREELIRQFHVVPAPFPLDFTDEYLRRQNIDHLRHVLAGLWMHRRVTLSTGSSDAISLR